MKIKVYSRGETVINADVQYQEPGIRGALNDQSVGSATGYDVASAITDYTDTERSDISHDDYAVVTEDDGGLLWKGWLTGNPETPAPAEAGRPSVRPRIVCLCGSTRFYDEFRKANLRLTLAGQIVLSIGCDTKSDEDLAVASDLGTDPAAVKVRLDELHKRKIDLADEVLVVSDETGYFGQSTAGEIRYAAEHRKQVRFAVQASGDLARETGLLTGAEGYGLRWDFPVGSLAVTDAEAGQ